MKIVTVFILLGMLASCSTFDDVLSADEENPATPYRPQRNVEQNVHYYVEQLAKQLFITSENITLDKTIVVSTFLPVDEITRQQNITNSLHKSHNAIGHQIQESFVTLATQAGLKVTEFKTTKSIKIENDRDLMLSRNLNELNDNISADYFLTGNYTEQEHSLVVNVRLIEVKNQRVIAAATDYIPSDILWSEKKSILKNGNLYRRTN